MMIIAEVSNPVQVKPWWFQSRVCFRLGWLWFAIGFYTIDLHELRNYPFIQGTGKH